MGRVAATGLPRSLFPACRWRDRGSALGAWVLLVAISSPSRNQGPAPSRVSPLACKQAVTDQRRGSIFSVSEAVS